jgi:cellulose synthase/poly-beta-1,6-N-acetylglucosamine synthase-like glycosyltransferase
VVVTASNDTIGFAGIIVILLLQFLYRFSTQKGPRSKMISLSSSPEIIKPKKMVGLKSWLVVNTILWTAILIETINVIFIDEYDGGTIFVTSSSKWFTFTLIFHIPYFVICIYLIFGLAERFGFLLLDVTTYEINNLLPEELPLCCVQLAMFNEHFVSERIIEAACSIDWPRDKFEVQVLDDSTEYECKEIVDNCIDRMRSKGINITLQRRIDRSGYKAGALEEGRKKTNATFLALFDADFLPTQDFLYRCLPHFYKVSSNGILESDEGLALLQTQWGHLNAMTSALTASQCLWVDDHHSVQMQWRSRVFNFVNFTGTAGVWRASAIEKSGGWKHASLVEDCELSFRALFAGYRTAFDNTIVQPAELPNSVTAYKAQQKRWTQGWVQLCRMHFIRLVYTHKCSLIKKIALMYHMIVVWQWPFWFLWLTTFPFLIWHDLTLVNLSQHWEVFYILPMAFWLLSMAILATLKTKHTYTEPLTWSRILFISLARLGPYIVINSGIYIYINLHIYIYIYIYIYK